MITNGFLAIGVRRVITRYFDRSPVGKQMEVVGRLFVAKTHALIATDIYARKMIFRVGRSLLSNYAQTRGAKNVQEKQAKKFHSTAK